jgi:hypothetical protein
MVYSIFPVLQVDRGLLQGRHKSVCRICGRKFEPPLGLGLHAVHMRTVHGDFIRAEKPFRYLLVMFSLLEVFGWTYTLTYLLEFTFSGLILRALNTIFGLGLQYNAIYGRFDSFSMPNRQIHPHPIEWGCRRRTYKPRFKR